MNPTPPAFDADAALQLADGDAELLRELLTVFTADAPGQMDLVRAAVARRDAPAVRDAAHSLKGSLRVLGAAAAEALAQALEQRGAAGRVDDAEPLVAALGAELERLLAEIATWLG
jgi:HPt (histidine-containing phosphotransfer) domain-containing protein